MQNLTNAQRIAGSFSTGVIVFETDTNRGYIKTSTDWSELTNETQVEYIESKTNAERLGGSFNTGRIVYDNDRADRAYFKTSTGWDPVTNVANTVTELEGLNPAFLLLAGDSADRITSTAIELKGNIN